jgi:hypothetical protein
MSGTQHLFLNGRFMIKFLQKKTFCSKFIDSRTEFVRYTISVLISSILEHCLSGTQHLFLNGRVRIKFLQKKTFCSEIIDSRTVFVSYTITVLNSSILEQSLSGTQYLFLNGRSRSNFFRKICCTIQSQKNRRFVDRFWIFS